MQTVPDCHGEEEAESSYVPALTSGHELWAMTERITLRIQAAKMSFLHTVPGLTLGDRVRSSGNRKELGLLLRRV